MKKKFLLGLMAMLLPWTVWAQTLTIKGSSETFIEGCTFTYAGDAIQNKVGFTVLYDNGLGGEPTVLDRSFYDIACTKDGESIDVEDIRNIGSYVITVTGNQGAVNGLEASIHFTVEPIKIDETLILTSTTKRYGQEDQEIIKSLVSCPKTGLAEGEAEYEDFLKCLQVDRNGAGERGDVVKKKSDGTYDGYQVIVNGKTEAEAKAAGSNYLYTAPTTGSYTTLIIMPKPLNVNIKWKSRVYTGKPVGMKDVANNKNGTFWEFVEAEEGLGTLEAKEEDGFDDVNIATFAYINSETEMAEDVINAGTYNLTATLGGADADNYIIKNNGEITLTVGKKSLKISALEEGAKLGANEDTSTVTWKATYGDEMVYDLTSQFTFTAFVEGENNDDEDIDLHMKWNGTNVVEGGYAVKPYVGDTEVTFANGKNTTALPNYTIEYATVQKFVIEPKTLTGNDVTISKLSALGYQGKNFAPKDLVMTLKETEDAEDEAEATEPNTLVYNQDYTYTVEKWGAGDQGQKIEGESAKDAGDNFKVVVNFIGNYSGSVTSDKYEISKLTLTITPKKVKDDEGNETGEYVKIGHVYGGTELTQAELMTCYNFDGFVKDDEGNEMESANGEDNGIGLTMARAMSDLQGVTDYNAVGDYPVRLFLNGERLSKINGDYNKKVTNYIIDYDVDAKELDTKYHITQATLKYWVKHIESIYTSSLAKRPTSADFEIGTNAEELNLTFDATKDFTNKPDVKVLVGEEEKEVQTVVNAGTYNLVVSNKNEVSSKNFVLEYDGTYQNDEERADYGKNQYTIKPAQLTITALDQQITYPTGTMEDVNLELAENTTNVNAVKVDDANIWFNGIEYAWEWKAMIQKLGSLVACDENEEEGVDLAKRVGQHTITFAEDAQTTLNSAYPNYTIMLKDGILTVQGETEITLDRAAVDGTDEETGETTSSVKTLLEAYNGVEKMDVILGGDRVLNADYWYTLVLPFETTVREISNAFGYAVVDVPNLDNKKSDDPAFKLKVDSEPIPANTLFLIKIDESINLGEVAGTDKSVKFEKKTIEYNPEYNVEDNGHNVYQGVYESTQLNEDHYWFLYQGSFWNAGKNNTTILPLGGYVWAKNGAAARIYVEEADGTVTAINAVTGETIHNAAEGWYTIGGVKLNGEPTEKGIYINNGVKVVVK